MFMPHVDSVIQYEMDLSNTRVPGHQGVFQRELSDQFFAYWAV